MLFQIHITFFLPWNIIEYILKNVLTGLFYTNHNEYIYLFIMLKLSCGFRRLYMKHSTKVALLWCFSGALTSPYLNSPPLYHKEIIFFINSSSVSWNKVTKKRKCDSCHNEKKFHFWVIYCSIRFLPNQHTKHSIWSSDKPKMTESDTNQKAHFSMLQFSPPLMQENITNSLNKKMLK